MIKPQKELRLEELLELARNVKDWKNIDSPDDLGLTANHHFQGYYKGVEINIAMIFLKQYYSISASFNSYKLGYKCFYEQELTKNVRGAEKIKELYSQVKDVLIYQSSGNLLSESIKQTRTLLMQIKKMKGKSK